VRVRVGVYNVQGLRKGVDAVARALHPDRPEVLLVQECGSRRAVSRLADALGMEFGSSHRLFHRVRNAVLFLPEWRVVHRSAVNLSRQSGRNSTALRTRWNSRWEEPNSMPRASARRDTARREPHS